MKLIPDEGRNTANYWCSWRNQRLFTPNAYVHIRAYDKRVSDIMQRDILCDEFLFGKWGLLPNHMQEIRRDMYVLLDDGWDIPYKGSYSTYGSLVLNEEKFPYGGSTPAENLAILNKKILDLGYAGTALWVPMSCVGESKNNKFGQAEFREYWTERAKWLHEAGIAYIKVDWGFHARDIEYRRIITDVFRKYAPEIQVEHASCDGWFRLPHKNPGMDLNGYKEYLKISDAYRCYDVRFDFNSVTTLARAQAMLSLDCEMEGDCKGYVNVGEEPYIAAALCCTMGIMSHPLLRGSIISIVPDDFKNGISHRSITKSDYHSFDHYVRALRWQRLAPALPFEKGETTVSEKWLEDTWTYEKAPFPYCENELIGKTFCQTAPQIVSRGTPLPEIVSIYPSHSNCKQYEPYIAASKNRETGVYTIATLPRTIDGVMNCIVPQVDVVAKGLSRDKCFGVFGEYKSLTLYFDEEIEGRRLFGGDILLDEQDDLTTAEGVCIEKNKLILGGALLSRIGLARAAYHDLSDPGSVFRLV